ncbi:MAG: sialate O-acetylesterase [Verrucomicrobia bacterium]|nr:sialate O-acetylesterase [Verrucomicrobiota bacterium]
MNLYRNTLNLLSAAMMAVLLVETSVSVISADKAAAQSSGGGKKLLIYVLAGQSNMQGHAEVSTLAYLPKPAYVPTQEEWAMLTAGIDREIRLKSEAPMREELLKDPANAKLPKKEFGELLQKTLKAEVDKVRGERYEVFRKRQTDPVRAARDKELAAIFTANVTDQKVLETAAAAKSIKGALEVANEWQTKLGLPVGKHTYIAAYGGVNRGPEPGVATGPLSTGFGARPTAFGPEYAFGIMLEKHLDQPVLIIKTAWGGKSLHYDFRPPSAGPYQLTANEKEQVERWKVKKAAWDKYISDGGTAATMVQMDKDIKALEKQKQSLQQSIAKLPKDQQAAEQEKIAAMNAKSKELREKLVPPPGDMPAHDQASFYWNEMIGFIHKVLADPKAYHPEYYPKAGFEVAGGLWFQGFNDQFDPEFYGNYASNMVHYIQDIRKEVKQPKMPFVIGVLGTPAFPEEALTNNVAQAQRKAASAPELAGTVAAVESWPLTTPEVGAWRTKPEWPLYGSNAGYHYDGSGRFFIRLGDECATAMLKLMGKK